MGARKQFACRRQGFTALPPLAPVLRGEGLGVRGGASPSPPTPLPRSGGEGSKECRRGFTLIEMLVALTILTVLATLSIAIIPRVQQRTKASRGGDLLQGWLLVAKQWAIRDRTPHGVRLMIDPNDGFVHTLQYIERPDPIAGGTAIFDTNTLTTSPQCILIPGQDLGGTGSLQAVWPVLPGDYIQLYGGPSYTI